jgi:hypothetical protein
MAAGSRFQDALQPFTCLVIGDKIAVTVSSF